MKEKDTRKCGSLMPEIGTEQPATTTKIQNPFFFVNTNSLSFSFLKYFFSESILYSMRLDNIFVCLLLKNIF